jgi:hypothetical protein
MSLRLLISFACFLLQSSNALVLNGRLPQTVITAVPARFGPAVMMPKKKAGNTITVLLDSEVDGLGEKGALVQ